MIYKILVADDEPIERAVIIKTIKSYFGNLVEITQAENGREAVELYRKNECQIALLDIEMPGINGLESAAKIRELGKDNVILFLTAFDDFSYAKKALYVRAMDYLLKPVNDEELVNALETAIRAVNDNINKNLSDEMTAAEVENHESCHFEGDSEEFNNLRTHVVKEMIKKYIVIHYMEDISLQDAARNMNYADAYFCRLFRQCFHTSFTTYLTNFRINKAKLLLSDITVNVREVSDKVGYHDSNYFTKVFKRMTGLTPSEYRLSQL